MGINNLNTNSIGRNNYEMPFKGKENNSISNPVDKREEVKNQQGLTSKEYAYATKATAMAQILTGDSLNYSTTPQEYVKTLIKQGKVPNKDFYIENVDMDKNNGTLTVITELNSNGEKIKEAKFVKNNKYSGSYNELGYYNPKYEYPYKSISYEEGYISMDNFNVVEQKYIDSYKYRPDGSLKYYLDYKDNKGTYISKSGKIMKFNLRDKDGNLPDRLPESDDEKSNA